MLKILLFISLIISTLTNFNQVSAEVISIIPLKKPDLSRDELNKKISKNILKPIKKPNKNQKKTVEKKITVESKKISNLSFKIPKKKPTVAGKKATTRVKLSKYYSKKDFIIAKKAISEMQKSRWTSSLKIA